MVLGEILIASILIFGASEKAESARPLMNSDKVCERVVINPMRPHTFNNVLLRCRKK